MYEATNPMHSGNYWYTHKVPDMIAEDYRKAVEQLKSLPTYQPPQVGHRIQWSSTPAKPIASPPANLVTATPTDQKVKTAASKPKLAMIPQRAIQGLARVFAYGAKKYAPGNFYSAYMTDGAGERYISAAFRHLGAMQCGDGLHTRESVSRLDEESGLPHVDHAIASLVMLRSIMTKSCYLPADPGDGKEPPK